MRFQHPVGVIGLQAGLRGYGRPAQHGGGVSGGTGSVRSGFGGGGAVRQGARGLQGGSRAGGLRVVRKLRGWRKAAAEREGVPVYAVLTNEQLAAIATKRPATLAQFPLMLSGNWPAS